MQNQIGNKRNYIYACILAKNFGISYLEACIKLGIWCWNTCDYINWFHCTWKCPTSDFYLYQYRWMEIILGTNSSLCKTIKRQWIIDSTLSDYDNLLIIYHVVICVILQKLKKKTYFMFILIKLSLKYLTALDREITNNALLLWHLCIIGWFYCHNINQMMY